MKEMSIERKCYQCKKQKVYKLDIYCAQCLWDTHYSRNWYWKDDKILYDRSRKI